MNFYTILYPFPKLSPILSSSHKNQPYTSAVTYRCILYLAQTNPALSTQNCELFSLPAINRYQPSLQLRIARPEMGFSGLN